MKEAKVDELPTMPCIPNTIYLVRITGTNNYKQYVSNKDGTALYEETSSDLTTPHPFILLGGL